MMKKIVLASFFLWTFFSAQAQQQDDELLDQYLRTAADNNPELKARYYGYMAAQERATAAGIMPDPEVSFGYLVYPRQRMPGMTTMNAQVMQMLPWLGMLRAQNKEMAARAEGSFMALQQARYELFEQVRTQYYRIYQTEKEIEIMLRQVQLLQSMERMLQAGIEAGRSSTADWLRVRMQVNEMQAEIEDMREMSVALRVEFNALLNRETGTEVNVTDSLTAAVIPQDMAPVLDSVLTKSPRMLVLDSDEAAAQHALRRSELMGLPEFGVGLQFMRMQMLTGGVENMFMPMISARIPLYRGRYRALRQEMQYELDMIATERQGTQNMLRTELEMILTEYRAAERKTTLLRKNVTLAEQAYRVLMDRYSVDRVEFEQLLEVLESLLDYQVGLHKALVRQNIAVARLERLMAEEVVE